jgi:hypothetical protein
MNQERTSATNIAKQIAIAGWAVAVFAWYFHQFSPAFIPILRGLLHRIWR